MSVACRCGNQLPSAVADRPACLKCGIVCCPACVFSLDAATYCGRCAESILDAQGVPLTVSTKAGPPWMRSGDGAAGSRAITGSEAAQWLILVAKDQMDLFSHLVRAFSRDEKVHILLDRRKDYSRNPPGMEDRLRTHGAAVIRRRN